MLQCILLFNQGTLLACITNYKMMIVNLQEGICLCTSFYLFKEFEEYKHGQDSVYEGTSTDRVNNGCSRHTIIITGCRITQNIGKKFWWIKNLWGRGWGDDGFGRIFWGSNAFNPITGKNDFNLLY